MFIRFLLVLAMGANLFANDIILKESAYSVEETVHNIRTIVESKGMKVFDVIDHRANAMGVNMSLNDAQLIIFGNPKVGTLLMQEDMTVALDLPLKILVFKDHDEKVKVAYRDGDWLKSHHFLQTDNLINKMNTGMDNITNNAVKKVK